MGDAMRKLSDLVRSRNPVILRTKTTVQHACQRMRADRAGAVLVVSANGQLEGIFTRGDVVNRVLAEARNPAKTTLAEVMTAVLHTAPPNATVIDALRVMDDCGCRHLPIVEGGKILGLVFRGDFRGLELDRIEEEEELWERI
ncbi:MAG TPA: CBS domain-containing protein [Stellaceae bacterium]|nr:CBS domain-containing protein [Stellaceae bacterium]